jgi:hypothetical protein
VTRMLTSAWRHVSVISDSSPHAHTHVRSREFAALQSSPRDLYTRYRHAVTVSQNAHTSSHKTVSKIATDLPVPLNGTVR